MTEFDYDNVEDDILEFASMLNCQEIHVALDNRTGLRAIVVIHSTKLGPAIGGCRFLEYDSTYKAAVDAIRLAQGMSYKASLAGLDLGGGKSVLLKPKELKDRTEYFKAFGRFLNKLNGDYIGAVDSGTSITDMDIISEETRFVTSTSHGRFSEHDPSSLTAFGVERSIEAAVKFKLGKDNLNGLHLCLQGVGHVGMALIKSLTNKGVKITAFDVNSEALDKVSKEYGVTKVTSFEDLLKVECDVFSPCALGAILNEETIPKVNASIIAGAANNQLKIPDRDSEALAARDILYAPDFLVNAGGLIYVAGQHFRHTEQETKDKISDIYVTLMKILERAKNENATPYDIAHTMAKERIAKGCF